MRHSLSQDPSLNYYKDATRDHSTHEKPEYFCDVHKITLRPSLLETKNCISKKCEHLLLVLEVIK